MRHDPELDAATYMGGAMRAGRARRFEDHLLECEACWAEVTQAHLGRSAAEAARELAPQGMREQVRMLVDAAGTACRRRLGPCLAAGGVMLAVVVFVGFLVFPKPSPPVARQPEAIAAAIADFRGARLPAGAPPAHAAPDLSGAGFELVGSGSGEVGNLSVDAFGYRDTAGRRVALYLSASSFPDAAGAHFPDGHDGPWTAASGGVELLCASHPLSLLALSDDVSVLRGVATTLGVR